jgi:hypothetical protein
MHQHIDGQSNTCVVPAGQAFLAELADRIRDAHVSVVSAFTSWIDNAILAGKLLNQAKKQTKHGQWTKFLERCDVGERQSQRYMKLAELVEAKPTCKSDLTDLSIEAAIKKLSPPKLPSKPVAPKQSNERSKPEPSAPKTGHADIIAAWINAPAVEHPPAVAAIGLVPLLDAMPPDWWSLIEKYIAERQKSSALTIEATALADSSGNPGPDDDLTIPGFLRRELPPSPADTTPEIPNTATENIDAQDDVDDAEDGANDELAELERRAAERDRKVKLIEHTTEVGGALKLAFENLGELGSDCREVVDSAPENLQQTERIQAFENSADQLEDLDAPEVPDPLGKLPITYSLPKRRYMSRQARASDVETILQACAHALESVPDEQRAAAQALAGELYSAVDTIQCCEFPGMYQ